MKYSIDSLQVKIINPLLPLKTLLLTMLQLSVRGHLLGTSKELESPPSDNFSPWSLPRADLQCGNWNLAYGWLKDNQTMAGGMNWIDYGGILESSQQIGIGERFIVDKDWVTPYIRNPMLNDVSEKVLFFLQNNPSDSVSGLKLKGKYNTSYKLLPGEH